MGLETQFATPYSPFALESHRFQRLSEILDQIVRVLQPRREADEAFADAELGTRVRRQALMRRGGGMGDEALGVAEIVGDARDLEPVEAAECAGLAALDLEADQRRSRPHLLLHGGRLRMIGTAGIDQPRDLRMVRKYIRDLRRRLGLRADA